MLHQLPGEIINLIYEYSGNWKDKYNEEVLQVIKKQALIHIVNKELDHIFYQSRKGIYNSFSFSLSFISNKKKEKLKEKIRRRDRRVISFIDSHIKDMYNPIEKIFNKYNRLPNYWRYYYNLYYYSILYNNSFPYHIIELNITNNLDYINNTGFHYNNNEEEESSEDETDDEDVNNDDEDDEDDDDDDEEDNEEDDEDNEDDDDEDEPQF
jgi:hypothetical protein